MKSSLKKVSPNSLCRKLLLEGKLTDEAITAEIKKAFPDSKFKRENISSKRWDLWKTGVVKEKLKPVKVILSDITKTLKKAPKKTIKKKLKKKAS